MGDRGQPSAGCAGTQGEEHPKPFTLAHPPGRGEGRPVSPRGQPGGWGSLTARTARVSHPRRSEPAAPRFSFGLGARSESLPPRHRPPGPPAPPEDAATGAAVSAELPSPAPGRLLSPGRTGARPRPVRARSLSDELEALRRGSEPVSRGREQGCRRAPGRPDRTPLPGLRDPRPGAARDGRRFPARQGSSALLRTRTVFSRSPECPFSPLLSSLVAPVPPFPVCRCPLPCSPGCLQCPPPHASGGLCIPCPKFLCLAVPRPVIPSSPCPPLCTSASPDVVTSALPGASVSPALRCRAPRCPIPCSSDCLPLLRASGCLGVPSFAVRSRVPQCPRRAPLSISLRVPVPFPVSLDVAAPLAVSLDVPLTFGPRSLARSWMSPCLSLAVSLDVPLPLTPRPCRSLAGSWMSPLLSLPVP